MIHFWATLAQFWPSSGQKMTGNGWKLWFPTIISMSIHTIQFKLVVYTCWLRVQKWFAFEPRWPNFGLLVAKRRLKMGQNVGFQPSSEQVSIQFKFVVHTCWVSFQNWFAFGPRWTNFGLLMATIWPKMVISDHYLKKCSRNPVQVQCIHLLGKWVFKTDSLWGTLAEFGPSSGQKITRMVVSDHYPKKYSLSQI